MVCSKTRKLKRLRGGWDPNVGWATISNSNEWTQIKNKIQGRYQVSDAFLDLFGQAIYAYDSAYLMNNPTFARQVKSQFIDYVFRYLQTRAGYDNNRRDLYGSAVRKMWDYVRTVIHRGPVPVTRAQIAANRARWRQKRQQQIQATVLPNVPWIGSAGRFTRLRLGKLIPQQARVRIGKWRDILGVPRTAAAIAAAAAQPPPPAGPGGPPAAAAAAAQPPAAAAVAAAQPPVAPLQPIDDDDDDEENEDDDLDDPFRVPSVPGTPAGSRSASPSPERRNGSGEMSSLRRIDPKTFAQRKRLLKAYRRGMILFPKYRKK